MPSSLPGARDVWREHILFNAASFAGSPSDNFAETTRIDGMPARLAHTHDSADYGTTCTDDSWNIRLRGRKTLSGGNV